MKTHEVVAMKIDQLYRAMNTANDDTIHIDTNSRVAETSSHDPRPNPGEERVRSRRDSDDS